MQFFTCNGFSPADTSLALMVTAVNGPKVNDLQPCDLVVGPVRIPLTVRLLPDVVDNDYVTSGTLRKRQRPGKKGQEPIFDLLLDKADPKDKADAVRTLAFLAPTAPGGCNLWFTTPEGSVLAWQTREEPRDPQIRNQRRGRAHSILADLEPGDLVVCHIQPAGRDDLPTDDYLLPYEHTRADHPNCGVWLSPEQYEEMLAEQERGTLEAAQVTPVEEPVAVEPVAVEPVAVQPVAVVPVTVEPVAVEPVAVVPVAVVPVTVEPVAVVPVTVEPFAVVPVTANDGVETGSVAQSPVELPVARQEVRDPVVEAGLAQLMQTWNRQPRGGKRGGL